LRIILKHTSADSRVPFIINKGFIISLQKSMPTAFVEDYVINSCSRQYCSFEQLFRITQTVLVTTKALHLEVFFYFFNTLIAQTFHGGLLISKVFWVIKVTCNIVTSYVAHLCQCIIILSFNIIPGLIDAYFLSFS
jgi:hypothetical protein